MGWFIGPLLSLAGFLVQWFVSRDSPEFEVVQAMTAILLIALIVFAFAFWPSRWFKREATTTDMRDRG
ncbi:MAG TPA: hypothetical protein VLX09_00565 [Stellaceae bacterium]|nr:hypothetical protein [Stellaceae bacterium]